MIMAMNLIHYNCLIILISIELCLIFKYANLQDYYDDDPSTRAELLDQDQPAEQLSSFDRFQIELNSTEEIPKPWIKKSDLENSRTEEWVDPAVPLRRSRTRPTETDINKYLLPDCGENHVGLPRIVGGNQAQPGAYPWMVLILYNGDPWCGGSILNANYVLTAAHCFLKNSNPFAYSIRVGSTNRKKGSNYKIKQIIIHERFHLDKMFNSDIALLKIAKTIELNKSVSGICLPTKTFEETAGNEFIVIGWGQTSYNSYFPDPIHLRQVRLEKANLLACSKRYRAQGSIIYRSQICTWNPGKDACQGDSGSPAMELRGNKMFQVGIVSYGITCADEYPGIFTKVSYFLTWIIQKIKENS